VRAGFRIVGVGAGLVSGWYAHEHTSSWVFALFVFVMVSDVIGGWIGGIKDRTLPSKVRIFWRGLPAAIAIGALAGCYWLWQVWWLAAIIGFVGYLCGFVIAIALVPALRGAQDTSRQLPGHVKESPGTPTGGAWTINYPELNRLLARAQREYERSAAQPPRKRGMKRK
jgi:hypothetical protein